MLKFYFMKLMLLIFGVIFFVITPLILFIISLRIVNKLFNEYHLLITENEDEDERI